MTERSITVSASYSRKVNLGNYESKDYWHSESRELPADSSQEQVDRMRAHLHKTVVDFVERQIAPQKPQDAPSVGGTNAGAKTHQEANNRPVRDSKAVPRGCAHATNEPCWPCKQAFKNGAVPVKPKEAVPDTKEGAPF